jgi:hypothetical protein
MFPSNKMLPTSVSIIIYTILIYVPKCSAEKVTVENILDLSVFGPCNINLKWFRELQFTTDFVETILVVQQKRRKDYALTTIDNATRRVPMVSPMIGLFEGCVLNIIVGLVPNDLIRQDQFMNQNNYTYSSTPFSTYILIPYTYKANENVIPPRYPMLYLPVRVFYLLVPIFPDDDVNLYTHIRTYSSVFLAVNLGRRKWKEVLTWHLFRVSIFRLLGLGMMFKS